MLDNDHYDCIDEERQTDCAACGMRYTQIDCGGAECPHCEEEKCHDTSESVDKGQVFTQ